MELIFNHCGEIRRAQLAKSTFLTSISVLRDLFRSLKVCSDTKEIEWGAESYRTYSIPGKTAVLVPEFAVEDLPSAGLHSRFLRLQ